MADLGDAWIGLKKTSRYFEPIATHVISGLQCVIQQYFSHAHLNFQLTFNVCNHNVFQSCISQFSMNRHENIYIHMFIYHMGWHSTYFNFSHTSKTNVQSTFIKASKFAKTVFIRHSYQSHAVALRLNLDHSMYSRMVREAGNKLQGEESYKKLLLWRKQLRIAH